VARTIAGAERTLLAGQRVAHFLRVRVANHLGTLVDLRTVSGADYQLSATIVSNVDTPADTATVVVRAGRQTGSLAPLMVTGTVSASGRLIDVGRSIIIDVATLAIGSTPSGGDWRTVFDGTIDTISQGDGQRLTLSCRNRMLPILDATTASTTTILPAPAQDMLASLLTLGLGAGAPAIVTPASPGWTPAAIAVERGSSVWQKMAQIADQIGWLVRYRWNGNTPELRFFAPNRSLSSADWTLSSAEVAAVREAALDLGPVRNEIQVGYRTSPTGALLIAQAQDFTRTGDGVRRLIIDEEASSQVDTLAEAQAMADAILSDLKAPPYSHTLTHRHALWCVEVGDIIDVPSNGVTHDLTQRLAVVGTELTVGSGGGSMTLRLRGAPASRTSSWLTLGGGGSRATVDTTTASASFTASGAVRVNVIGPVEASSVRAAVSTSAPPSATDVDTATGGLTASANMAALTSPGTYAVGTTVYVAAAAYIGSVQQRVVQLVVVRDAAAGTVAVGPDLEVRMSMDATTATVTWVGDGTIEMSEDGGAYAAPPGSPFTRARGAQGADTVRTLTFRAILSGQTISNTVTIPPRATVDTDTVSPDLRLIPQTAAGGDPATYVEWQVTASNPKAGGPAPTITATWSGTLVDRWNGSAWVSITSGATLTTGDRVRATRPSNGATPGVFTVRSEISGGSAEEIQRSIPMRTIVLPPAVVCTVIGSTATSKTYRITSLSGGGQVRYIGGSATQTSGLAVNVLGAEPQDYAFARPPFRTGDADALFECVVNGLVDSDSVTIPEVGRDTAPILTRVRIIAEGATTCTIRVSASTANSTNATGLAALITLVQRQAAMVVDVTSGATDVEGVQRGVQIAQTDGYYGAIGGTYGIAFRDYVVTKPAIGALPARVTFRVDDQSGSNLVPDADSVDIQPQVPLTPGRIVVLSMIPSGGANLVIRWRAFRADGTQETNTSNTAIRTYETAPGASTEGAPVDPGNTYDSGNAWFTSTITRVAGSTYRVWLVLDPSGAGGTQRTEFWGTLPAFVAAGTGDTTPRIESVSVVNTGTSSTAGDLRVVFGGVNLPAGGSYRLSVDGSTFVSANVFTGATSPVTVLSAEAYTDGVAPPSGKSVDRARGLLEMLDAGGATVDSAAIPYNQFWGII
jgi:hypothetical protein